VIRLSTPPSLNNVFRNVPGVGRVRTGDYKRWITQNGYAVLAQRPEKHKGDVAVHLRIGPRTRSDLDNRIKPILDLLVKMQVIEDDSRVVEIRARWMADEGCEVDVQPCAGAPAITRRAA
jgi:Holliday junction resolvase RusA-like endonuclease